MKDILTVNNLSKSFGNKRGLTDVSFNIPKGKIVGLIGPNGAGKSTIMKCILGIYSFSKGSITFNGHNVTSRNFQSIGKKIGSLIEAPALYPFLTGSQHFKLYSVHKEAAQEIVNLLKMGSYIDEKVTNYSYGMKQKFGIALALVNNPELVILDEPMNGLDLSSTIEIRRLILSKASEGTTFIVSSHILSELEKIVTDIILINHGKIILQKPLQSLQEFSNHYYILNTNNNTQARKLLTQHKFQVLVTSSYLRVQLSSQNLTDMLRLLLNNNIDITELSRQSTDLESVTLHYISRKETSYD